MMRIFVLVGTIEALLFSGLLIAETHSQSPHDTVGLFFALSQGIGIIAAQPWAPEYGYWPEGSLLTAQSIKFHCIIFLVQISAVFFGVFLIWTSFFTIKRLRCPKCGS